MKAYGKSIMKGIAILAMFLAGSPTFAAPDIT